MTPISSEVVVYSYSTGQLVIFDNFLKEKNKFDLGQLIKPKPNIICMSKTGWWCLDETSSTITNYTNSFVKSYSLPEIVNPEKEIVKMAEIEFTYPTILYADNYLAIPYLGYNKSISSYNYEYKFRSNPVINYNSPEVYAFSNDSLVFLSLDKIKTQRYRIIKTHLHYKDIKAVTRSFNTYFFIQSNAILGIRQFWDTFFKISCYFIIFAVWNGFISYLKLCCFSFRIAVS